MKIIDATGLIVGRMATQVAKAAMMGETIAVVNCDKAVFSGRREMILREFLEREWKTNTHYGPYRVKLSDRIVRRTIRGMLPIEKARGREAFKRVMCYIGVPLEFKDKKTETFEKSSVKNLKAQHFVTVKEISDLLGGNHGGK